MCIAIYVKKVYKSINNCRLGYKHFARFLKKRKIQNCYKTKTYAQVAQNTFKFLGIVIPEPKYYQGKTFKKCSC